ncbi:pyridoxamine 5'-phosphate oxidase family protein [Streptacidiphilus carbonis]|jgi:hypothetical protein|uniref:pyridoxamine 5'-phosphate oxidase family protein n=1 Tax=Streptacidiphilus carbonis TaxID=105422 RepID=UPI0006936A3B|nr:pyridoxamine 5'-phosphate oxidase family protein [Streptacidiphilus carbonis]
MDPIDLPDASHATIGADECLRLLSRGALGPLGRIVYTRHALPVVLPVRFGLDFSGALTVAVPGGSGLAADLDGSVVALHVDNLGQDDSSQDDSGQDRTGAAVSVMVHGTARAVPDGTALRLVPELVSGLRLERVPGSGPVGSADK